MFCPSCGAPYPEDANFCAKCGHAFHGTSSPTPQVAPQPRPVVETHTFTIPFPAGSEPTKLIINFDAKYNQIFEGESLVYLQRISGIKDSFWRGSLKYPGLGAAVIWGHWKDYFEERINELGVEGWQLAEPFEPAAAMGGLAEGFELTAPFDRLACKEVMVDGFFGKKVRHIFTGAKFRMTRTTFS